MSRTKFFVFGLILLLNCSKNSKVPEGYDPDIYEQALKIAQSTIILDGHVDVPYRLVEQQEMDDISQATTKGDFDFPRAKQGGLDVPFMSIYIPADYQTEHGASKKHAEKLIAMMDSIVATNWDKFAPAITPDDVKRNFEKGLISFPYGMENGSAIEDDLSNVEYFYKKGIRYITLTHGKKNLICDSSFDPDNKDWNGLSPFGRKVVAEMNRLGIMVDISHVSDSTFYQVLRESKVPPICSHSSCRLFTPGMERNVSDDMLKALGEKGGVIQINFGSFFLTQEANEKGWAQWNHSLKFMDDNSITDQNDPRLEEEMKKYDQANPFPYASIENVVDHIDHVVKVAGIDHVGLGSDFDGVGDSLPAGLKSVADYPNLIYHLLKRGYSEEDIKKILSGNVLRVWQQVIDYAKQS
ncbi:dipeptidase [candidate division KSB1 bacterium]|nr:dipeptidase [candidate division KSB1 bacterium]